MCTRGEQGSDVDADPDIPTGGARLERRLHTVGGRIEAGETGDARRGSQFCLSLSEGEDNGRDGRHHCPDQAKKDPRFVARGGEVGQSLDEPVGWLGRSPEVGQRPADGNEAAHRKHGSDGGGSSPQPGARCASETN
jgi:hypothetical protein